MCHNEMLQFPMSFPIYNKTGNTNMWLGSRELQIVFDAVHGFHAVIDSDADYERVYEGGFTDCQDYMNQQYTEYMEEVTG